MVASQLSTSVCYGFKFIAFEIFFFHILSSLSYLWLSTIQYVFYISSSRIEKGIKLKNEMFIVHRSFFLKFSNISLSFAHSLSFFHSHIFALSLNHYQSIVCSPFLSFVATKMFLLELLFNKPKNMYKNIRINRKGEPIDPRGLMVGRMTSNHEIAGSSPVGDICLVFACLKFFISVFLI